MKRCHLLSYCIWHENICPEVPIVYRCPLMEVALDAIFRVSVYKEHHAAFDLNY